MVCDYWLALSATISLCTVDSVGGWPQLKGLGFRQETRQGYVGSGFAEDKIVSNVMRNATNIVMPRDPTYCTKCLLHDSCYPGYPRQFQRLRAITILCLDTFASGYVHDRITLVMKFHWKCWSDKHYSLTRYIDDNKQSNIGRLARAGICYSNRAARTLEGESAGTKMHKGSKLDRRLPLIQRVTSQAYVFRTVCEN